MKTAMIARMTWEAFRDAIDAETVAVIPIGSVELEGPISRWGSIRSQPRRWLGA